MYKSGGHRGVSQEEEGIHINHHKRTQESKHGDETEFVHGSGI
jgi:hypothetical protein